jgi:Ca2+/Na+ antiporter
VVLIHSSKKGNAVVDGVVVIVVLFCLALLIITGNKALNDLNTDIQADDDIDSKAKAMSADINTRYPSVFDAAFVFFTILVWMTILVLSFVLDVNPVFMIFAVILLIVVLFVGAQLANTYGEFIDDDEISTVATSYPMMTWIFEHFVWVVIVMVFTVAGALFAKSRIA